MPIGLVHPYHLDESISNFRGVWCTFSFFIVFLIEIPVSKRRNPDQKPRSGSVLFA